MAEEWRPIAGFEGVYDVSSEGRVRSLPRVVEYGGTRKGISRNAPGRILTARRQTHYPNVSLYTGNKNRVVRLIHRLVLEAFVGPRPDGMHACHNDGNRLNNSVSNLRWDTITENNRDIVRQGRNSNANKTHCPSGHKYDKANTYEAPSRPGTRYCRICVRERNAVRRGAAR